MKARTLRVTGSMLCCLLVFTTCCISQVTTVANGSWTTPSTWSTGSVPGAGDDVIIRHDVTISGSSSFNVTIRSLTIENGTHNIDATLSFNNGTVTRSLTILNNLSVTATTNHDCRFQAQGANTSVSVGGDLLLNRNHTGAGEVFGIRLRYGSSMTARHLAINYMNSTDDNQEVYLQETSSMILSGNVTMTSTGGAEEPSIDVVDNSYFECNNMSVQLQMPEAASGVGRDAELRVWDNGRMVIHGNCTLNRTGGRRIMITIGNSSTANANLTIEGNLDISHLDGLNHTNKDLLISATNTSTLRVMGNVSALSTSVRPLTFEFLGNSTLDIDGNFSLQGSTNTNVLIGAYGTSRFFFGGDIRMNFPSYPNASLFTFSNTAPNNSTVTFDGTANQTVPGLETYGNLIVNNPTTVSLTGNITVNNQLSLLNGKMLAPAMRVTLPLNAGLIGSSSSYICNGTLSRALGAGGPHWFYIGDTTRGYSPVRLNTLSAGSTFEATYYPVNAGTVAAPGPYPTNQKDPTLQVVSNLEYWTINRTAGTGNADVTLGWNAYSGVGSSAFSDLRIARWNGTVWNNQGDCTTSGDNAAGLIRTVSALTAFNHFTLSSITTGVHILPVYTSLTSFTAQPEKTRVKLSWKAADETNTNFYIIERSSDGTTYEIIKQVAVSKTGQYVLYDEQPLDCSSYYRLKQVERSGISDISKAVMINWFSANTLQLFPAVVKQGSSQMVRLRLPSCINEPVQVQVVDANGRPRYRKRQQPAGNVLPVLSGKEQLASGVYFVQVQHNGVDYTFKLLLQ